MNLSFENRVALVTGAASGMGLATAKAFAEAGAAVVLADFKEDAVKAEAQKLVAAGHKAIAVRCDVSDDAQVAAMRPLHGTTDQCLSALECHGNGALPEQERSRHWRPHFNLFFSRNAL